MEENKTIEEQQEKTTIEITSESKEEETETSESKEESSESKEQQDQAAPSEETDTGLNEIPAIKSNPAEEANATQGETNDEDNTGKKEEKEDATMKEKTTEKATPMIGRKLFVGGIPNTIKEDVFKKYWEQFGELESAFLCSKRGQPGQHRGFGFICFKDLSAAQLVSSKSHRLEGMTSDCTVNPAKVEEKKFFIGDLGRDCKVTKEHLREHFSKHGTICEDGIFLNEKRGFGFVTMEDANGDLKEKLIGTKQKIGPAAEATIKIAEPKKKKGQNNQRGRGRGRGGQKFGFSKQWGGAQIYGGFGGFGFQQQQHGGYQQYGGGFQQQHGGYQQQQPYGQYNRGNTFGQNYQPYR
jgi:RNA recognition motif-containing protein